jgi:hypothetical protein
MLYSRVKSLTIDGELVLKLFLATTMFLEVALERLEFQSIECTKLGSSSRITRIRVNPINICSVEHCCGKTIYTFI